MNAPLSVGVVGYGSIGSVVADALHAGRVPGAVLAGVTVSSHGVLATPRLANVAAALAVAGTWDGDEATVVADPDAVSTSHEIECCGEAGEYRFTIRSRPSSDNPASSAVVPYAVLRAIADDAGTTWRFQ